MGQIKIEPQTANPVLPILLIIAFLGVVFLLLQFGVKYMKALWYNREPPSKKHHHKKKKKSRKDSSSEESSDSSSE